MEEDEIRDSMDARSGRSRANLRRRRRCGSPLKFLHVQARPREIKFNGVSDEDLSWPHTRTVRACVRRGTCVRIRPEEARRARLHVDIMHAYPRLSKDKERE